MIEYLSGKLIHRSVGQVVLECNGVGYGVDIPASTDRKIPSLGELTQLWIYTRVREDSLKLYGFAMRVERQVFEILMSVSGVGPKVALAILSHFSVGELFGVVADKNVKMLQEVPGIGKRSAEKILLELDPKLEKLSLLVVGDQAGMFDRSEAVEADVGATTDAQAASLYHDLRSALVNLGFRDTDVSKVCRALAVDDGERQFEDLLKQALVKLNHDLRPN